MADLLLPLFGVLIPYLLMVIGIGLILQIISIEIKNSRSRSWPSTTGTVTSSEVKRHVDSEGGVEFYPQVRY